MQYAWTFQTMCLDAPSYMLGRSKLYDWGYGGEGAEAGFRDVGGRLSRRRRSAFAMPKAGSRDVEGRLRAGLIVELCGDVEALGLGE